MQALMVFFLFIIAVAVAPQAMLNLFRVIDWLGKAVLYVIAFVASFGFLGYLISRI